MTNLFTEGKTVKAACFNPLSREPPPTPKTSAPPECLPRYSWSNQDAEQANLRPPCKIEALLPGDLISSETTCLRPSAPIGIAVPSDRRAPTCRIPLRHAQNSAALPPRGKVRAM